MGTAYFKYFLSLLLFASNGTVARFISLSSYDIVLFRSFVAGIMLTVIFLASGHRFTFMDNLHDLFFIALSGISMGAEWLFLFEGYATIGVGLTILLNYCGPAIVVAFSPLLFGERITREKGIALAAALMGAVLISGDAAFSGANLLGILWAVLSAFGYAGMVLFNKMSRSIKDMENPVLQVIAGFILIAAFTGLKKGWGMDIARSDWLPLLWISFFNTGGACYCYFSSLGYLPAQTIAICGYFEPLMAVLMAAAVLGERLQPLQLLGAALIICGALVGEGVLARLHRG